MDKSLQDNRKIRPCGDDSDIQISAKIIRDIRRMSPRVQLVFGTCLGLASGILVIKTGKYVCVGIGTGLIVLQLATQNDYIKFNLLRALSVEDLHRSSHSINVNRQGRSVRPFLTEFFRQVQIFLMEQPNLASGMVGGFFLGLGLS